MTTIESIYKGELRTKAVHVYSGTDLITDAPLDNQGKAESFSPTDLVATSLGSCMLSIMGIAARTQGIEERLVGTTATIVKIMVSDPRRIGEIKIDFHFPSNANFSEKERKIMEKAAHTCPVALSIHPDIKQTVSFNY